MKLIKCLKRNLYNLIDLITNKVLMELNFIDAEKTHRSEIEKLTFILDIYKYKSSEN